MDSAANKDTSRPEPKPMLKQWQDAIRAGIRYRQVYGKSNDWARYKNMYRGYWNKGVVPVNIIYSLGRALVPQIYFRNPRVGVYAKKPGYGPHSRIIERIDNYLINETGLKKELKSLVLDCYLCGVSPIIIGYDTEFGFNPAFLSDDYPDMSLTTFSKKGERIEYSDNVKPGMPWAMRCNPMDFVVPWGTNRWEDARWFAFRKMRTLKDIKEDPKYKNKDSLKGTFHSRLESSDNNSAATRIYNEDPENSWVEVWQVHDKRSGRVFALSLDHDSFLRDDFDYLQTEGLPADVLGFNEDPDYFWWPPDARMIEVQQDEINDIRTMAKKHRRVALLKVLYDKSQLGKDGLAKLLDDDIKAAVEVDAGASGDVRKAVALFQSHVPPDLIGAAAEVREDTREIIGFSRNQMGAFEAPGGRRTAHEVETVRAASMIRIDERRDAMADLIERVIRKENQLIFSHWTEERVVDVVGPEGARYWVRFTGKQIKSECEYRINPEEALPEDKRTRRAEALEFFTVMLKSAQASPGMNIQYLVEQYASQFDWLDPKQLFPNSEQPGRSPEKAMQFYDYMRMAGSQPGASGQGLQGGQGE